MVEDRGIEPRTPECKTGVFPLALAPHESLSWDSNPASRPYQGRIRTERTLQAKDAPEGIEPPYPRSKRGANPLSYGAKTAADSPAYLSRTWAAPSGDCRTWYIP
jgi:hypothetical protein